MHILVTGKNGQVTRCLQEIALQKGLDLSVIGRPEINFEHPDNIRTAIISQKPDIIISAAAYTMVDKAETEAEIANQVNANAPEIIAKTANELKIPLIHISTDYVFSGDKNGAYVEDDKTAPIGEYGKSKLAGENAIIANTTNYVILRTSWVYSPYGNNFVKTMLRLSHSRDEINVVADQYGCPTYAFEIARACLEIAQKLHDDAAPELRGIFHLTAQGKTNWAAFAKAIFTVYQKLGEKPVKVNKITTLDYPTPAKRPANSLLSGEKLYKVYGIKLDEWQKSLNECISILLADNEGD